MHGAVVYHDKRTLPVVLQIEAVYPAGLRQGGINLNLSLIHIFPEAIAIGVTVALHKWKHQTLVSIAGGTLCYVLLVQMVF